MIKNFLLVVLTLLSLPVSLSGGEDPSRNCAAMDHLEMIQTLHPEISENMQKIEAFAQKYIAQHADEKAGNVVTIPVVVHVVWRSTSQNISDGQINSQITVLNDDFRRMNSDADNTWSQAADTEIEFCMATVDPSGNATSGITRTKTKKRSFSYSNDGVKFSSSGGHDAWPADQYLNLWVCNLGNGLLGYAQFPGGDSATDGVVCSYRYFGTTGTATAPFDLGRTATHEVGHWLNLRHIWGDGGCSYDDFISDTPQSDAANYGCATGHVSCSSVDMVQNYMDYSDDGCMNLYTNGQKARMQSLFAPGGARESLLSSGGCGGGGGPTPSCTDGTQNGNETGVDCGGPDCPPCSPTASCTDGIENGNETGVDCGGPDCPPCTPTSCDAPANVAVSNIFKKKATASWDAVSGASAYQVQYHVQGSSSWSSKSTANTSTNLTGLSQGSVYEYHVRADCSGTYSDFSPIQTFTAGVAGSGRFAAEAASLEIYPNPARDRFTVILDGNVAFDTPATVTILDLTGRVVYQQSSTVNDLNAWEITTEELNNGIYFVKVNNGQNEVKVTKVIVNR